ncbi:MAG: class I SAM-dependent methyltransferase [Burkholderiales bacterium]
MPDKPFRPPSLQINILSAAAYNEATVLQREVAQRMSERLAYLKHAPRLIIDVGAGTGFGTGLLQQHYPAASIIALETQPQILSQAFPPIAKWKRWLGLEKSATQCACSDFTRLPLRAASVDMIWSNLALHHHDPDTAFKEAQRVLKSGGLVMFSLLGPDTLKELRAASGDANMKRLIDMHDVGDVLSHNGFTAPVMDMETLTLTYAKVDDLLQDLHRTGEENLLPEMLRHAANQNHLTNVTHRYEGFRADGKLPATYEIVYGHAWKGEQQKLTQDGRQVIEFRRNKSFQSLK